MIKTIENSLLNEKMYRVTHKSGLEVFIIPKKGFVKSYAIFATKYGSVDNVFSTGDKPLERVPDGIAHFLEHKLFEGETEGAFEQYAKTGGDANAYTSFDRTAYLFSCTSNFAKNLKVLLNFVQKPYFTDENVKKEQGIIAQEIKMYEDDPSSRVMYNLFDALYHENPVKIDIAGTVESISKIDKELLYDCYHTFYSLQNMVLCVCGDVEADEVMKVVDECVAVPQKDIRINRAAIKEPDGIVKDYCEQSLAVSKPIFMIGFKDNAGPFFGQELVKNEAVTGILLEMIFGKISPLYEKLYNEGLINRKISSEYICGRDFGISVFEGQSSDPKRVRDALLSQIDVLKENFDTDFFEACKKKIYGQAVCQFDGTDDIANHFIGAHFSSYGLFDMIETLSRVTAEDAKMRLHSHFHKENMALSVINPSGA